MKKSVIVLGIVLGILFSINANAQEEKKMVKKERVNPLKKVEFKPEMKEKKTLLQKRKSTMSVKKPVMKKKGAKMREDRREREIEVGDERDDMKKPKARKKAVLRGKRSAILKKKEKI